MKFQSNNNTNKLFGLLLACAALTACGKQEAPAAAQSVAPPVPAAAQEPAHVILYTPPEKQVPADLPGKLAGWKADGTLSDVFLTRYVEDKKKDGYIIVFNDLAVLDFASEAAYEDWKSKVGDLGPDVIVSRVDALLDKRSRRNDSSQSIYVTGVYEALVDKAQYKEFTDDYIDPNMGNQYSSGIMTRYTMYLEREPTDGMSNPKAFLVSQYANQAEFDRKGSVKGNYKTMLLAGDYPMWAHIDATKKAIRRDFSEITSHAVPLK